MQCIALHCASTAAQHPYSHQVGRSLVLEVPKPGIFLNCEIQQYTQKRSNQTMMTGIA